MEGVFQNEYDNSGEECERLEDQRVICRARADEETLDLKPQPRFNASQEEERDNPPLKYKNLAKKSKAGAIKNRKFDIEKEVFVDEKSLRAKKNNKAALIENVKKSTKSKGNGSKLKTKVVELKKKNELLERRCEELLEELKGKAPKIDEEKEAKNSTGYAAGGAIPSEQPKMQWKSLSVKADRPVQVYSQIPLGRNKNPADLMADDLKNYELDNRHKYVPRDLSRKNMNLQDDIDRDIKYAKFMK